MQKWISFSPGSKVNQIVCSFLICIPIFSYGNSIGWMSPMTLLLQSQESPKGVPLTDTEISWMASLPYLSCVPGAYLMAYLGDTVGRKATLLFMSFVAATIWALKLCSMNIWVFIVARILVGITMAGGCVTCPAYIKEITDSNIRGALGCWVGLFETSGCLFAYIICDFLSYTRILWVLIAIPIVHFVVFLALPDSPSYLIKKGKYEKARNALAWLKCKSKHNQSIQEEIDLIMKEQSKDEETKEFMMKSILTDKVLFKAFQIALITSVAREVCGAVPVQNFAADIFSLASEENAFALSPNQQAILLGVVALLGSFLASNVIERCGRKVLMIVTCTLSGLSMCLLATWFLIRNYNIHATAWIPVITLCVCIFCDAAGLMPISYVIGGEIFSYQYRGTVLATTMAIASVADFFQLLFFKPLANSVGVFVAFYFFGVMCLLAVVYTIARMPETKNRTLAEIYSDLQPKNTNL